MRKLISNTIAALANFIDLNDALELDAKAESLSESQREEIERERGAALEGYARAWAISPRTSRYADDYAEARGELVKQRRQERKANERTRQDARKTARRAKEMRLAY